MFQDLEGSVSTCRSHARELFLRHHCRVPNRARNGILPAGNHFKLLGQWTLNTVVTINNAQCMIFLIVYHYWYVHYFRHVRIICQYDCVCVCVWMCARMRARARVSEYFKFRSQRVCLVSQTYALFDCHS